MSRPLAIDLFCGLGGWTEGLLSEGFDVVGFDVEQHVYGEHRYPAQLVLQDVRTIHGKQFKDASLIVASSPCPEFSYMAMPWKRAKQIAAALRGAGEFPVGYKGSRTIAQLTELFDQPTRIQREASEAAGRWIPMIQENVKGAQPWVGPAAWHHGSYYLWGDVPALMPMTHRALKNPGFRFDGSGKSFQTASVDGSKNTGGSWFNIGSPSQKVTNQNPARGDGTKQTGSGAAWFDTGIALHGSKSSARKAASARIAKIPFTLASHIARVYHPSNGERVA